MLPMQAEELIPQKFPFRMIDRLVSADETTIQSSFTIETDNVLLDGDYFSEGGLIENMAQTAAAGNGYECQQANKAVPIGYIGAVKHVQIFKRPKVGDLIETHLELKNKIGAASIMSGKIFFKNEIIATSELTIFVNP
ncbi:MAG: 3-hydroxyacyl-ACP dehydratase [Chitinophagaceae bacterium]|nr:3-hydroxyacyl-ACP dehydratase [Chitinophagaceae bacterium]